MKDWKTFVNDLASKMGFEDYRADIDAEHGHGALYLHDNPTLVKENLAPIVESINHILQLVARKENEKPLFLDINNYRKERESLIVELARATARKVVATKEEIPLPAMNSYERRLAHMELAAHPEVMTESVGKGKNRYVVVRPVGAVAPHNENDDNDDTGEDNDNGATAAMTETPPETNDL
ncbi:MAG: hypothetical protein A2946_01130 [Candidatus Liptonbacteria bacterium RIFCSPLOWO2_01_FULL_53_13]|uniref:R3H domain-containing protein n=1 Tax=Candidatus Liptonbacteria bacterium RIFCSPLOWO2_01_FULL_53_13 TaxID=1798651 RepID=A0A1G2CMB8_9BACT|nr:MAG: hypothetical protein A2946_01130 [Candidatus Liptonbacteria bacterium RIFCSPLOWO2_01_FULL_53_13]